MTHRQFRTWGEWELIDLNEDDKVTSHLQRVAQRVQQSGAKDASSITLKDQKVPFERKRVELTPEEKRAIIAARKADILRHLGDSITYRTRTAAEARALKPWQTQPNSNDS